ncbi:MAG TPA: pitrilysin family protein [Polyangiaceae bacterium]|nr:pitrilysin family protein [Polyangiaceae bacterium]
MKAPASLAAILLLSLSSVACGSAPAPKAEALPQPKPSAAPAALPPDPEPWRNERPPAGAASELHFPQPEQAKLSNGLSLMLVRKPLPVASLSLVFRHGAAACPTGKSGLAALTARMLTEGTKKHPSLALSEEIEQLGTTLDEDAGRDSSSLSLSALTADLDRALELLGEVVTEPGFLPADFERVQQEWLDGLRAERQAPERLASLVALGTLLGSPHGSPVSGSLADVQKLTIKDIAEFHRKAYLAGDATLIVVGDVDLAKLQKSAERAFKKLSRGQSRLEQPFTAPAAPQAKQILLVDKPGAVQSALALAQPQPKRGDPGFEQRELLTTLFGGLFTSRLNLNLREEHAYTYGARAQNVATAHWGALYIATSVRSDVTADALKEALKELNLLRDAKLGKPLSAAEVGRARADLVQSVGARLEYSARIGSSLADLWLHSLPLDYYARYPGLLATETPDSLSRLATSLEVDRQVVVVVGDRKLVEAPLKALGYSVVPAPQQLIE